MGLIRGLTDPFVSRLRPWPEYFQIVRDTFPADLIGYWPLWSPAGATVVNDYSGQGNNGTPTAVTFGGRGMGDGQTSASFNGTSSKANMFSAALAADVSLTELTLAMALKVSAAGVWTDGANRYGAEFNVNAQNRFSILRSTTNNVMTLAYRGQNVNKQVNITVGPTTAFFHLMLTVSISANELRSYLNGVQSGATVGALTTALGTLAVAMLGSQTVVGSNFWSGSIQHVALWKRALPAAAVLRLGRFFVG